MFAADIDDDAGAAREIDALHEFAALRAFNVTDFIGQWRGREHDGCAEHRGLLFAVGADFLERERVEPKAFAFRTFAEDRFADGNFAEFDLALRAWQFGVFDLGSVSAGAAERAKS